MPKIWNNVDKTCADPTELPEETLNHKSHPRRFRRDVSLEERPRNKTRVAKTSPNADWENFEKWEPLVAIGLFICILGIIVLILKCWIQRSSDADKTMETKAAKSLKAKLAVLKHATVGLTTRPEQVAAQIRAGPTDALATARTPTTIPDKQPSSSKVKALMLSMRMPPFKKLEEDNVEPQPSQA